MKKIPYLKMQGAGNDFIMLDNRQLKLDPALMASPMLTTITDACSILVFFIFVMAILGGRQ